VLSLHVVRPISRQVEAEADITCCRYRMLFRGGRRAAQVVTEEPTMSWAGREGREERLSSQNGRHGATQQATE
jgi:hypothetical protein